MTTTRPARLHVNALTGVGLEVERAHHEVGTPAAEINYKFNSLLAAAIS